MQGLIFVGKIEDAISNFECIFKKIGDINDDFLILVSRNILVNC